MNKLVSICMLLGLCAMAVAQRPQLVHDPVMAYEDGTWHLYSTGFGIQHMTSTDRTTWTMAPQPVMTVIPRWTRDSVPGFTHHVWAPDIIRWHGRWWLAYSCSTFGRNGSAIGLLSTRRLASGLWDDEGCIVASCEGRDNWNAIDPNFVIDADGQPWLVWGSFWDGIQIAPLDTTMHLKDQGNHKVQSSKFKVQSKTIARRFNLTSEKSKATLPVNPNPPKNPTSDYAGPNAIEAPFIFRHDGWYYLFVSWDYCCQGAKSNYRVAVGRSRSVDGPYVDSRGIDMRYGGGNLFFEGDKREFEAVGHCAVYHVDGDDIFLCHGYSIAHDGAPILIQRLIRWTPDGWPQLQ